MIIRILQQLSNHRLYILAHVPGLGQGRTITNRERHVQALGNGLGQERLPHSSWPEQQDVGLVQLHVVRLGVQDVAAVLVGRRRVRGAALLAVPGGGVLWLVEGHAQAVVLGQACDVQQVWK